MKKFIKKESLAITLYGGFMLCIIWAATYAFTVEQKMQIMSSCIAVADISADIQTGRRTHRDTFDTFLLKVPGWLAYNGVQRNEIEVIKILAESVFKLPIELSPIEVYESTYTLCIGKVQEEPEPVYDYF